jgi:hypothetical protein
VGEIGRILQVPPFLFLGIANGICGALYLLAVYGFLRRIVPRLALRAFVLFVLGGGLGGIAYVYAQAYGMTAEPWFEQYFERFAWYELIEGQHVAPSLLMTRLYYTLPLALGYLALNALIDTDRNYCTRHLLFTMFLLAIAGTLNMRVAPMIAGIGVLYLLLGSTQRWHTRWSMTLPWVLSAVIGMSLYWGVTQLHATYLTNVARVTQEVALLIPLITATFWYWLLAKPSAARAMIELPWWAWYLACSLTGYISAYCFLYIGYQVYYGNWWYGGGTSAALFVSDYALVGLGIGVFVGFFLRWTALRPGREFETWRAASDTPAPLDRTQAWIVIWALAAFALAVSATGGGWFMRFTPERFLVILGVPLSILAAAGVYVLPRWLGRTIYAICIACGITSIAVASAYFQGHAGRTPGADQPFDYLHYAHMTSEDARLLTRLPEGTVIAPPWSPIAFSEVLALRPNTIVVGGPGAMNIGNMPFARLQADVKAFFAVETDDKGRRNIARRYCLDYVYCPDTCPVSPILLREFQRSGWLKPLAATGDGRIYLVALE